MKERTKMPEVIISMDGNFGCALLGENLQEGDAEFVCVDDAPPCWTHPYDKERWAMAQAFRRLCSRHGKQFGYYWDRP